MPKNKYMVGRSYAGNEKECVFCGYVSTNNIGIKLHLKYAHNITKSVEGNPIHCCFACKREFRNKGEFLRHMKKELLKNKNERV